MSLINDALKRAKDAQLQAPPSSPPALQLRPVEPAEHARHGLGLLLPVAISTVALCGLFFLWRLSQGTSESTLVQARTRTPSAATVDPPPTPTPPPVESKSATVAQAPEASPVPPEPAPSPTASSTASASATATMAPPPPAANPSTPDPALTNPPAAAAPPLPSPAPLKLQAIVFNPQNPSATINGKPLFVGEHIGEFRVVAIGRDSATLAGPGQTNLLTLP